MYGGVAQRYCLWKFDGEPYKKDKAWYVRVLHPVTKASKEVRFYTDKKHADLMPKQISKYGPFCKVFYFKDEKDTIVCVKEKDMTAAEREEYFAGQWDKGNPWRFGMFFGGVWYAPNGTEVPPIKNAKRAFTPTWAEFKVAGQEHLKKLNPAAVKDSPWFND